MKKNIKISYKNFIQKEYLNLKLKKKLNNKYSKIFKKISKNLDNTKDTFHSLSDKFIFNFNIKDLSKFKKYKTIVIIGMGGSILGSEAIYSFLEKKIKKNFLFINDIDLEKIKKLKSGKDLKKTLFIIISKSGTTIETLSNSFALQIIKKKSKNVIIISEKKDNPLYVLAQKQQLNYIEHKSYISGRYSVFSEVGMLPAYLMGLNIKKLRENILIHFKKKNQKFLKESSITLSSLLKTKFKNIIFFNYVPQLTKFLYWNQQLISESLGKSGRGFLPTISQAPKDHHSLLQLYLDGPRDKLFYIFSYEKSDDKKIYQKNLNNKLNFLNKKSLSEIKLAQKNAFIKALIKNKIPYREFKIIDFSEQTLGELFSYFILETAIIGKISGINPFNQPAVEQVKTLTKKLLA